jgi:hypothetical protein
MRNARAWRLSETEGVVVKEHAVMQAYYLVDDLCLPVVLASDE